MDPKMKGWRLMGRLEGQKKLVEMVEGLRKEARSCFSAKDEGTGKSAPPLVSHPIPERKRDSPAMEFPPLSFHTWDVGKEKLQGRSIRVSADGDAGVNTQPMLCETYEKGSKASNDGSEGSLT